MKGDNIMLNKEKYAKEILDIVCQDGTIPAVVNNTVGLSGTRLDDSTIVC